MMIVIYTASEPYSAAMLEAALIDKYQSILPEFDSNEKNIFRKIQSGNLGGDFPIFLLTLHFPISSRSSSSVLSTEAHVVAKMRKLEVIR